MNDDDITRRMNPVPDPRPRQVFPDAPRSYTPPEPTPEPSYKKKGSAVAAILGGLLALALIVAGALGFMYTQAANRPAPAPVTVTATVTETLPTTVTEMTTEVSTVTETTTAEPALPTELFETRAPQDPELDAFLEDLFGQPTQ